MKKTSIYLYFAIAILAGLIILAACEESTDNDFSPGGEAGIGGSLARFTIANDHLYTVDDNSMHIFSVENTEKPVLKNEKQIGFGIETIFPRGDHLFLGSQTGMYIYDINNPANPFEVSFFSHIKSCDPVVADQDYAYVTLNTANSWCWRNTNELQVVDISDIENPTLAASKDMNSPLGLSIHNDTLYVCDKGLKVLDVSDPENIIQLMHFSDIQANDLIYNDNKLFVIGDNGFYQYKIEDGNIEKISEILIGN